MKNGTKSLLVFAFVLPVALAPSLVLAQPAPAQDTTNPTASETVAASKLIPLHKEPILVEHGKTTAVNPINQTHIQISLTGNGTLHPPNSTETIKTNDMGNAIVRLMPEGDIVRGEIHMSTEDGSENATVYFTEISKGGKGVGVTYFTTDSVGRLSFLNNTVAVFQDELLPDGTTVITAWEWEGGQ